MRNHKATTAAAALAAAGALLLTGCGGGSKGGDSKKIAGADSGASASTAPSASASAPDAANRPKVTLPAGNVLTFDPEQTGDSVKDAILRDNAEYQRAIDEAIDKQDPKSKNVTFYSTGQALIGSAQWIGGFIQDGTTVTGTVRFLNRRVTLDKDGSAGLTYCADETKGFTKDRKTGKVNVTPPDKDSYVSYVLRVRKNDQGVWQVTQLSSERGGQTCQP
uniref:Lipoprotein n=1 Tax=Streptomyces sp. NBC_00003 TaxID=2903608 RepID=A0AAU2V405_9ACTN